jgi:hypothetical protein
VPESWWCENLVWVEHQSSVVKASYIFSSKIWMLITVTAQYKAQINLLVQTQRSWVRIPLDSWVSFCIHSVSVISCIGSGFAAGWSLILELSPTPYGIHNFRISFETEKTRSLTLITCTEHGHEPVTNTSSNSSSSYIATDGQSASSSWCRTFFGAHNQILIFFVVWQLFSFFFTKASSLTRGRIWNLQCNHSPVRVTQDP